MTADAQMTLLKSEQWPDGPPSAFSVAGEIRALFDLTTVPLSLIESALSPKESEGADPIILFPGYASGDRALLPLRHYLENLGYQTEGWGLGTNLAGQNLPHTLEDLSDRWQVEPDADYSAEYYRGEGGVPFLCDRAYERVRTRTDELGSPVTLIGWSLGGYIAREVARDLPDRVSQVITLGSPIVGGPKYTRAASVFAANGLDLDWIEREVNKRDQMPIAQPITAIYSKSDGVVNWRAALDRNNRNVDHIEVNVAHLGMGFNRKVYGLIRKALRERSETKTVHS